MKSAVHRVFIGLVSVCLASGLLDPLIAKADNNIILSALGAPYFQDFNTLSSSTESDTLPPGWVLSETGTSNNANGKYRTSTGTSSAGDIYSFGLADSTDRALGGIQDSSLVPLFGASFTNHTGGIIQSLTIKYTGEEWRLSRGGRADKIVFELSTDATSLNTGTWKGYDDLTFFTPNQIIEGAKNGTATANRTDKQYTISGMTIAPGGTFWIRWRDHNDALGKNDGLAVDDFSIIPNGIDRAPSLITIYPADKAFNVALDTNISIAFSEPVNLADGWLELSCSISNQHAVSVSGGLLDFGVNPNVDFVYGDICTITILAAKVTDQDSADPPDTLDKDYSFSFSALPLPDDAPIITNISPANNEAAVLLDSALSVHFSEPVSVTSDWFTLGCSSSGTHSAVVAGGPSTYVLTPTTPFQYDESCTLTIAAATVHDLDVDDPPDIMPSDFTTTFSTLSTPDTAPFLQSIIPANDAGSIPVNQTFELTFNEPVAIDSRTPTLSCTSGDNFSLTVSGGPTVFQAKPDRNLNFDDSCSMTIAAQYITDIDLKDPPDAMFLDQTINFTTAENPDAAPTVTQMVPADGATNIAIDSNLTITFSEDILVTNPLGELICSASGEHAVVTTGNAQTLTINPDVDFANNESCSLTIFTSQIRDLDIKDPPDKMAENFSLTFSTAPPTDQPPTVEEIIPANEAADVPVDKLLSITFSEPVFLMLGWLNLSCEKGGIFSYHIDYGPVQYSISTDKDFEYFDTCTATLKADKIYDLDIDDPPDFMDKDYTYTFSTTQSPDEFSAPTVVNDENITPHDNQILHESIGHLTVQFSKDVLHDGTQDAADNPQNYRLFEWGTNHSFDSSTCENTAGDDKLVSIENIQYDSVLFKAELEINYGVNLPDGTYQLIVCGAHTIRDLYGTPLNDGANSIITFSISTDDVTDDPTSGGDSSGGGSDPGNNGNLTPATSTTLNPFASGLPLIPVTGFRQGVITLVELQETAYTDLGEEWLEVPALKLETSITGVPKENGYWNVTWLGSQVGWLVGSAQMGAQGNSVLTAHVWDALNKPGPFYGLEKLKFGDQVILHAWEQAYVYEVREVLSVEPENVKAMMKHQEKAWLTLVTCQGYDEDSGEYERRVLVRAVLMEVR